MDEKEKRKIERRIMVGAFAVLACAAGYLFYAALVLKRLGPEYYVIIFGCLFLFWLLSDVVTIACTKGFEGKTEEQVKAYRMYSAMNLAGLGGLGFFAVSMNNNGGLIGACIYAFTMMGKRKYKDEYLGIVKEEDQQEEEQETEQETEQEEELIAGREAEQEEKLIAGQEEESVSGQMEMQEEAREQE